MKLFERSDEEKRKEYEAQRVIQHAELEKLAKQAEITALSKKQELFDAAKAEYEKDFAGFQFKCEMWGKFLTVFIARMGNSEKANIWGQFYEMTFSTALNLDQVKAIRLVSGHVPDMEGELAYGFNMVSEHGTILGGTGFGNSLHKNYYWEVKPCFYGIPDSRPLFILNANQQQSGRFYQNDGSYNISLKTKEYVRCAKDDEIIFDGLGATIFVPCGHGEEVLHKILVATIKSTAA